MKDLILKYTALFYIIKDSISQWKTDVYDKELNDLHCCTGQHCLCGGMTERDRVKMYYIGLLNK